jgi:hypothetical protein
MLNPSTADASEDDPTIRRVVDYAKRWDCDGVDVINLFSFRATDPRQLRSRSADELRGPSHGDYYRPVLMEASLIVAAWGRGVPKKLQPTHLESVLTHRYFPKSIQCLGVNLDGSPKHPLYQPKCAELRPWPEDQEPK